MYILKSDWAIEWGKGVKGKIVVVGEVLSEEINSERTPE